MKQPIYLLLLVSLLFFGLINLHAWAQEVPQSNAQEMAQLRMSLMDMQTENAKLLGRIENLEFLLSQSRDEVNNLQMDDKALMNLVEDLKKQTAQLASRLSQLEAQPKTNASLASAPGLSTNSVSLRPSPQNGVIASQTSLPIDGFSSTSPLTTTSTVRPNGQVKATIKTQIPTMASPSQQGATSSQSSTAQRLAPSSAVNTSSSTNRTVTYAPNAEVAQSLQASTGRPQNPALVITQRATPRQTGSLGTISASSLPGQAGPLFADAKAKLLRFDYSGAEVSFRRFLELFGDDPQAGEARYWLAEALHQQKAYVESGKAYAALLKEFPKDTRAPDALVKLARSMRLIEKTEQACTALAALPRQYPNASSMVKAMADVETTRAGCSG